MDVGLATILSVMGRRSVSHVTNCPANLQIGTVWTGNPLSLSPGFSIDGTSPKVKNLLGNLLGVLGEPQGIGRSHNLIESDASLTRDDLYLTGDASTMNMTKFLRLFDRANPETNVISIDEVVQHSVEGLQDCIANNPYCWYGPYTGMIARNAGVAFTVRLLANHSVENPGGILSKPDEPHQKVVC